MIQALHWETLERPNRQARLGPPTLFPRVWGNQAIPLRVLRSRGRTPHLTADWQIPTFLASAVLIITEIPTLWEEPTHLGDPLMRSCSLCGRYYAGRFISYSCPQCSLTLTKMEHFGSCSDGRPRPSGTSVIKCAQACSNSLPEARTYNPHCRSVNTEPLPNCASCIPYTLT